MPGRKKGPPPTLRALVERLDTRVGGMDARLGGMDARLEMLSTGVETMHVEVNARLTSHEAGLVELGLRAHGQDTLLQGLAVKVDSQGLLLDQLQDQNRLTIEAIENTRAALEQRIERLDHDSRARDGLLEVAVRELRVTLQQTTLDVRDLSGKVDRLARLDERVSALERRRE
jgi:hypothetical protein